MTEEHTHGPGLDDWEHCAACGVKLLTAAELETENARLRAEITRLEFLISALRECPTNHRHFTEMNPPRDEMPFDWRATHGYNFCPDCGTPLSAPKERE